MSNAALDLVKSQGDAFASDLLAALGSCYAIIEFDPSGVIQAANSAFLAAMGYTEGEITGRHHRIFCDAQTVDSLDYRRMWEEFAAGTSQSREFKRVRKDGRPIWIRASYMPLKDPSGRVYRVVKIAQDCTEEHERRADVEGKQKAISRAQAVIEFQLDGTIVSANENFLAVLGYGLDEIVGRNHSMFVEDSYARGHEYKELWRKLNSGEYVAGEFRRVGRGGKEIWIQASYNPIFDLSGKPCKVVKYATDSTEQKVRNADFEGQLSAIGKSQAVISFGLDGTVIDANPNFLSTMGYALAEIKGRHHSMFVDEEFARSAEYRTFWEKLNHGEYVAGRFRRIGRNGKEVWIQASYNPILDLAGRPFKVVKYATDVTDQVKLMSEIKNLAASASRLTEASGALFGLATRMNEDSQETSKQADLAQASAESVSKGVASVATNTEELKASIREIARSATTASRMSDDTKAQAARTNDTIAKLGASSKEIGNVIKVISSIAQQTNLLALNATIEAARAGEAGRGFAVVANEVKELAKQTAKATEEIAGRISAIQADSTDAIKAIADIGKSIEGLNQIAGTIAAAVEEQAATSNEVARIVQDQARAVEGIAGNVRTVSQAAGSTSDGARQVIDAATGLKELAASLESMVGRLQKGQA